MYPWQKSRPSRARGLKLVDKMYHASINLVAPLTGAWIETRRPRYDPPTGPVAPLTGAWIETAYGRYIRHNIS